MPGAEMMRLTLDLVEESDPIAGSLRRADGSAWTFTGWLEFTRAVEEARWGDKGGEIDAQSRREAEPI